MSDYYKDTDGIVLMVLIFGLVAAFMYGCAIFGGPLSGAS